MIVDTPVRIGIEWPEPVTQPMAAECPVCFAIVRKARLADHERAAHERAAHAEGGE